MSFRLFFFISSLLVSTYCKEGTFLMHFLTGNLVHALAFHSDSIYISFSFTIGIWMCATVALMVDGGRITSSFIVLSFIFCTDIDN